MKNIIVDCYENYKEEDRLTTNNARKIEFITTTRIFDELLDNKMKVLDCAAGTGVYAFYLADKGYEVTATDITPRHIELIKQKLMDKNYNMNTSVLDATDMNIFKDESFDVVLNMGPFYHLITENQRQKCFSESLRVLKKGGILVTSYIPRYYVIQHVAMGDRRYLDMKLAEQIINTGVIKHEDEKCFWTDTYYSSMDEMEELYKRNGLKIIDHFAQDGISPLLQEKVDSLSFDEFEVWCDYQYRICREKSILGASNHVIIAGIK
ncbi:MAG TPA: class I SAM-dependent methyltransferase [Lachnoclostridium phytofermentans]|uniref:Class I SAM-dependent methyltransferase n=1 Tax=Lachnoclostridium phytofermentans TaxID=66219 RepID=A0A3D2X2H3_9FIRM|nr:class I SAM-dependent methyltransferase [Lachnoclostridium sp.]HCL01312.1 class I SAM-dependent methyltransferase [Lachnoclostridium phytofermentans]